MDETAVAAVHGQEFGGIINSVCTFADWRDTDAGGVRRGVIWADENWLLDRDIGERSEKGEEGVGG